MAHFYIPFIDRIFELHGGSSQVCVIGQAGHSPGVAKETTGNNGRDPDHRANGRDSQWYQASSSIQHTAPSLHSYLLATGVAATLTQDLPPQPQQQVE